MKAAGISGDIRLISTLDSVAVGKSRTAVVAFIDATVANTSRSGDALERRRGQCRRESEQNGHHQPGVRESIVSTWTTTQLANETIAIPVEATNIGALAPAARAGYGGILLFGTTAPASMPQVLATLHRERPGQYAWMVMTDEEGGGVERLTNLVGSFPWAQTMGKNLNATQITAIARASALRYRSRASTRTSRPCSTSTVARSSRARRIPMATALSVA